MKTRITVIFDGAKFDFEVESSKKEVLAELNNIENESGYLHFTDVSGKEVRIIPSKIPLLEIEELEDES